MFGQLANGLNFKYPMKTREYTQTNGLRLQTQYVEGHVTGPARKVGFTKTPLRASFRSVFTYGAVCLAALQLMACGGGQETVEDDSRSRSTVHLPQDHSVGTDDDTPTSPLLAQNAPPLQSVERSQYILNRHRASHVPASVTVAYNPEGAPTEWGVPAMLDLLQQTANKWSDVCNVRITITGTTAVRPTPQKKTSADVDGLHVVGWVANVPAELAGFSAYVSWWFRTSAAGIPAIVDADMVLNLARADRFTGPQGTANLAGLLAHEWGHVLGLEHSDQAQSVMFANPYHTYAFQNSLRADDAAACAQLYGPSPHAQAMRVFNWAEQTFPHLFGPVGAAAGPTDGGHPTRQFPATGAALQAQGQQLFFRPAANQGFVSVGSVVDWLGTAQAAGF